MFHCCMQLLLKLCCLMYCIKLDLRFIYLQGVSFLEVKYQMLLSYLINLTYLMSVKIKGLSIKDDPAIKRLVEIRTVSSGCLLCKGLP